MSEIEIKNPKLFSEYELSESEKITCKQSAEAQKERLLLAQLSEENRDLAIIGYIQGAVKYKTELEKEARDYALKWGDKTDGTYACCRDGYLAGAEPREKRIEELEAQIEKMKCCGNCRYFDRDETKYCDKGGFNVYICDKWRFVND